MGLRGGASANTSQGWKPTPVPHRLQLSAPTGRPLAGGWGTLEPRRLLCYLRPHPRPLARVFLLLFHPTCLLPACGPRRPEPPPATCTALHRTLCTEIGPIYPQVLCCPSMHACRLLPDCPAPADWCESSPYLSTSGGSRTIWRQPMPPLPACSLLWIRRGLDLPALPRPAPAPACLCSSQLLTGSLVRAVP